jgi:hypothetical protein
MPRKGFESSVKVKDATKGQVSAVFSTFDVIDKDNDVTTVDAIKDGEEFVVSAYGHTSWAGELPVGKGVIRTTKSEAIADMQFFMDTTQGRDTFNAVSELAKSGLGEWSYGFDILDAQPGVFDGKDVRVLTGVKVFEVSPVLVGAGVNTRTLSVKSATGTKSDAGRAAYNAAIRPHTTATDNGDWNATQVKSSIPGGASIADLRSVFAWHSPSGDPEAKSSYKFAHHDAVEGPANIRACIIGIAALNGASGGTGIPDVDRRGVYNHLAGHLQDAGCAVPELRADLSPSSLKFADECAAVMASVSSLRERAEEIHTLRTSKGRTMSSGSVELLEWVDDELRRLKALIDTPQEDMAREYVRFTLMNTIGNQDA